MSKHVRQHFVDAACTCGYSNSSHSVVSQHIKQSHHPPKIYEIDRKVDNPIWLSKHRSLNKNTPISSAQRLLGEVNNADAEVTASSALPISHTSRPEALTHVALNSRKGRRKQSTPLKAVIKKRSRHANTISWISDGTNQQIKSATNESKANGNVCPICHRQAATSSGIIRHIRQHFIKTFCQCGYDSFCRDMVVKHVQRLKHPKSIYEVDEVLYPSWAISVGLKDPPEFGKHVFGKCKTGNAAQNLKFESATHLNKSIDSDLSDFSSSLIRDVSRSTNGFSDNLEDSVSSSGITHSTFSNVLLNAVSYKYN